MRQNRYALTTLLPAVLGLALLSACDSKVQGAPTTGAPSTSATSTSERDEPDDPTTRASSTRPSLPTRTRTTTASPRATQAEDPGIPTIDQSAPAQYCDRPFKGALGKNMLAVVVETPAGILDCEEAAAILFDYYVARPNPVTGKPPHVIGPLSCNQVPTPDIPQVVCADADNIIYSMWPQT